MGGSFDPVHTGHVTIAKYFCDLFSTHQLRLIPAGHPWQKKTLKATAKQRIDMLRLAFDSTGLSVTIDLQEIERTGSSYTIDTLRAIRQEVGHTLPLIFIMGSDQLLNLNTWHEWQTLFSLAHFAVAFRPGYQLNLSALPEAVYKEFTNRLSSPEKIIQISNGLTYFSPEPAIDISATEIRKSMSSSDVYHPLVPPKVLDYIVKKNLYRD